MLALSPHFRGRRGAAPRDRSGALHAWSTSPYDEALRSRHSTDAQTVKMCKTWLQEWLQADMPLE